MGAAFLLAGCAKVLGRIAIRECSAQPYKPVSAQSPQHPYPKPRATGGGNTRTNTSGTKGPSEKLARVLCARGKKIKDELATPSGHTGRIDAQGAPCTQPGGVIQCTQTGGRYPPRWSRHPRYPPGWSHPRYRQRGPIDSSSLGGPAIRGIHPRCTIILCPSVWVRPVPPSAVPTHPSRSSGGFQQLLGLPPRSSFPPRLSSIIAALIKAGANRGGGRDRPPRGATPTTPPDTRATLGPEGFLGTAFVLVVGCAVVLGTHFRP